MLHHVRLDSHVTIDSIMLHVALYIIQKLATNEQFC